MPTKHTFEMQVDGVEAAYVPEWFGAADSSKAKNVMTRAQLHDMLRKGEGSPSEPGEPTPASSLRRVDLSLATPACDPPCMFGLCTGPNTCSCVDPMISGTLCNEVRLVCRYA